MKVKMTTDIHGHHVNLTNVYSLLRQLMINEPFWSQRKPCAQREFWKCWVLKCYSLSSLTSPHPSLFSAETVFSPLNLSAFGLSVRATSIAIRLNKSCYKTAFIEVSEYYKIRKKGRKQYGNMKYTPYLFLACSNICHIFPHPTPHSLRHRSSIPSSCFTLPHHNSSSSPLRGTTGCISRSENGYARLQLF